MRLASDTSQHEGCNHDSVRLPAGPRTQRSANQSCIKPTLRSISHMQALKALELICKLQMQ